MTISAYNSMPSSIDARSLVTASEQQQHLTTLLLDSHWHPLRPEHPYYFPDSIWLYAGPEIYFHGGGGTSVGDLTYIIRRGHYQTRVKTFTSLAPAPLRAVLWDKGTHAVLFPTFADYPLVRGPARTDLRRYVSAGNTAVFVGGFGSVALINDVFGTRIRAQEYQPGPYYRSPRFSAGTVFEHMPAELGEVGNVYGVVTSTLPPGARSFYDTGAGMTVVFSIRMGFGAVTYLASDMADASDMGPWHRVLRAALSLDPRPAAPLA
eukprot:CAMPEP_0172175200 /NCGR_PEP_ID=MMETSP1050-20130122/14085_1 /TAXON_ID=233186 /ORGANISM="Cryptomonas curvata, Strain CCAP979/52" /LENGTH=263 /DNA_ID=CAMNT_0012847255 /DNA_START=114 /DNA_END=902 /DNA_ORIENTATION=+